MKNFLGNQELLDALNQRYAVKKFEKRDTDTKDLEATVKSILQLSPSSFWLQAYKFVIIKDPDIRQKLKKYSWDQPCVTDADLLVVFCVPTDFGVEYIEKSARHMQSIRSTDEDKTQSRIDLMNNKIIETGEELWITNYTHWLTKQVYLSLGNLLTSLAVLGIDSCPLEWILPAKYNEILWLSQKNLSAQVAVAIWKRDITDLYQHEKKVRYDQDDLFIEM